MAEWLKAPVLKTGLEKSNVGSNPSPPPDNYIVVSVMRRILAHHIISYFEYSGLFWTALPPKIIPKTIYFPSAPE